MKTFQGNGNKKDVFRTRKRQLKIPSYIMRKDSLVKVTFTRDIEGKMCRGKHRVTHLTSLCDWMDWGWDWDWETNITTRDRKSASSPNLSSGVF